MAEPTPLLMEDVTIIFRNFRGAEGKYNPPGVRNFGVLINDDTAQKLLEDGWNVKYLQPRDDDEDETPQAWLPVEASYNKGRPPQIYLITSGNRTLLGEGQVEILDGVDIKTVDMIVNPYPWSNTTGSGVKAYLKSMYVTIEEDPLLIKYSQMEAAQSS